MASNPKVKLNLKAVNEIMRSQKVADFLMQKAEPIAADAGDGFEARLSMHRWLARAYVETTDYESRRAEAKGRALSRAFGRNVGGGG